MQEDPHNVLCLNMHARILCAPGLEVGCALCGARTLGGLWKQNETGVHSFHNSIVSCLGPCLTMPRGSKHPRSPSNTPTKSKVERSLCQKRWRHPSLRLEAWRSRVTSPTATPGHLPAALLTWHTSQLVPHIFLSLSNGWNWPSASNWGPFFGSQRAG